MKEYSSYKSPTKQIAHSIQKSLQCVPIASQKTHQDFEVKPQRPLDLSNIVSVTPNAIRYVLIQSLIQPIVLFLL